jgi:HSP20 family protein
MNTAQNIPATDILASDTAWLLLMDLPGVAQESLSVTADREVLTVSTASEEDAPPRWFRRLSLPRDADVDGIEAKLTDGVLSVSIPRIDRTARQIAIG